MLNYILTMILSFNWKDWILAVEALLSGLIAIALLIPGDQPEKTLQWLLDLLKSISAK
jgi:hypothetical protein